jgi:subfamily B ATP-binding cassette protein MsbA
MFATDFLFLRVSNSIVLDLRRDLSERLIRLSIDFFERTKTGQIMARVMGDVDAVQVLTTNAFLMLVTDTVAVILMSGFMLYLSRQLTLVGVATLGALILLNRLFNRRLLISARASRAGYATISEDLQESIAGIREIKAFTHEPLRRGTFLRTLSKYYRANFRMGIWASFSRQISLIIIALGPVIVYYLGGRGVIRGTFSIGLLVAFIVYLDRMYGCTQRLIFLNIEAQSAMGAVERIFDLMDTEPAIPEAHEALPLADVQGEVLLKDVSFGYPGADRDVLDGFTLHIKPGERVALVGSSGSGKSTVVNLICRFYDVRNGAVLLDGKDIRAVRIMDVRKSIGLVPQDTFLFHTTVADNLRLGNPDTTLEDVRRAAATAGADTFVASLENGYDTVVGERGMRLSGGEKQRLSIARTILKDPRIVIFDEATSALDSQSERVVKDSMKHLMQGRTTLMVSHRLSAVADAHRIVVLDGGKIVEEGTHRDLMNARGLYARLYTQQMQEPQGLRAPQ